MATNLSFAPESKVQSLAFLSFSYAVFLKSTNIKAPIYRMALPVCQTYCTHT